MSLRRSAVTIALSLALAGASIPRANAGAPVFAGECDVKLEVTREFDELVITMPEAASCVTTEGPATVEFDGEATGVPGLVCAGGVAEGRASVSIESETTKLQTDIAALKLAHGAGGPVILGASARNASVSVSVVGTLRQLETPLSTCVNNERAVRWWGTFSFESEERGS